LILGFDIKRVVVDPLDAEINLVVQGDMKTGNMLCQKTKDTS
jgi:hypothetical protein